LTHSGGTVTVCNVTRRNIDKGSLTDLQQAILKVLWDQKRATADEIRSALEWKQPLTDSSVRTLLRRLESRGYLTHHLDGKTFVYEAVLPPARMAARAIRHIIDRFWAGSTEAFLVGMVDEEIVSRDELSRLAKRTKRRK
jgi:BlaI family transcriptional regulator, penicillinase repressor